MLTTIKKKNIGWKLLAWSGFWFIPSGILLTIMAWQPTPGPYIIGENYPYGSVTEAWQVSLAFTWIALGILLIGIAHAGERLQSRVIWVCLLICAILTLFPHLWLGLMLFLDDPTLTNFGPWLIALPFSLLWLITMTSGFILSWKESIQT